MALEVFTTEEYADDLEMSHALMELELEPLTRLSRDLKQAAVELKEMEVRFLVDFYYIWQEARKRSENISRASKDESGEAYLDEPHSIITWMAKNTHTMENLIKGALDVYSNDQEAGIWARSITGIGPVLSAGLLAHIDITKCPTVGHIWRFAGLDPSSIWLGKEKGADLVASVVPARQRVVTEEQLVKIADLSKRRLDNLRRQALGYNKEGDGNSLIRANVVKVVAKRPWNSDLKTLCWKISDSFVKFQNHENDIYGKRYVERKAYETAKNEAGEYSERAARELQKKNIKNRELRTLLESGKLPPGQLHMSAKRWTVKLFLAHYHHVAYESHFGTPPPKPYILDRGGHTHFIAPPNWPMDF